MTAPATRAFRIGACGAALLGPAAAWLRESGHLDLASSRSLLDVWLVVAVASAGLVVSILALRRRVWLIGATGLVLNGLVVSLYGFLALFFGLGGSR
ncbi:MAG TPA: hypothetical protein VMM93_12475 [Vicinamibacterales bacterium]|nr:hypothetical protein [Vicinamibacterales bacterium]